MAVPVLVGGEGMRLRLVILVRSAEADLACSRAVSYGRRLCYDVQHESESECHLYKGRRSDGWDEVRKVEMECAKTE